MAGLVDVFWPSSTAQASSSAPRGLLGGLGSLVGDLFEGQGLAGDLGRRIVANLASQLFGLRRRFVCFGRSECGALDVTLGLGVLGGFGSSLRLGVESLELGRLTRLCSRLSLPSAPWRPAVAPVASATTCSASGSTSSMTAIGALSPLRGPSFTMRV